MDVLRRATASEATTVTFMVLVSECTESASACACSLIRVRRYGSSPKRGVSARGSMSGLDGRVDHSSECGMHCCSDVVGDVVMVVVVQRQAAVRRLTMLKCRSSPSLAS